MKVGETVYYFAGKFDIKMKNEIRETVEPKFVLFEKEEDVVVGLRVTDIDNKGMTIIRTDSVPYEKILTAKTLIEKAIKEGKAFVDISEYI